MVITELIFKNMRHLNKLTVFSVSAAVAVLGACQPKYELDTDFTVPDELSCPAAVTLDVTSSDLITFSWTGGRAADGGVVLYNVLIDKESGDFSSPVATMKSDLGAESTLTLTQSDLNVIARKAGITPEHTGTLKWTVTASRGGVVRMSDKTAEIKVTRGEGIDNIPSDLYLYGSGAEKEGQHFRTASEGKFVIYARLKSGKIQFRSSASGDAFVYYADANGKLKEENMEMDSPAKEEVTRLTVDFNTLSVKADAIGSDVRCIWGCTFDNIAVLSYKGEGKFSGEGDIRFVQSDRPETNPPSWLSWTEERYYFIAKVNGADTCWGRGDSISAERPVGGEGPEFYELHEFGWSQWDHLWKMSGSLDMKHAVISIDTDASNRMIHSFENVRAL